jgi:tRNA (mo5U34)-methyltransferase
MSQSSATPIPSYVRRRIEELGPWFHNLHLPDGSQTCPDHFLGDFPTYKWRALAPFLPERLTGWTALDVGCNAGFYAFELARRGARVVAVDSDEHYLRQARWAAGILGLSDRITFHRMQVYDLGRRGERFDLVLFMGVFYHLRYPLLGLDAVARCVRRQMVFQTLTMPGGGGADVPFDLDLDQRWQMVRPGWPKMAFVQHRLQSDPTNWWVPNDAAARALLRSAGFRVLARPGDETYLCEPAPDGDGESSFGSLAELRAALGI